MIGNIHLADKVMEIFWRPDRQNTRIFNETPDIIYHKLNFDREAKRFSVKKS